MWNTPSRNKSINYCYFLSLLFYFYFYVISVCWRSLILRCTVTLWWFSGRNKKYVIWYLDIRDNNSQCIKLKCSTLRDAKVVCLFYSYWNNFWKNVCFCILSEDLLMVLMDVFRFQCYQAGFLYCRKPSVLFCFITKKA